MPSNTSDFAPPIAKTIGCFVALSALPLVYIGHVLAPHPLPWGAFAVATPVSLAGLGALIGRPTSVRDAIRLLCALLCRWKR